MVKYEGECKNIIKATSNGVSSFFVVSLNKLLNKHSIVNRVFVQQFVKTNNKETSKVRVYCPFVRGIHRWPVVSRTKAQ